MIVQVAPDENEGRLCLYCMLKLMDKLMWDTWRTGIGANTYEMNKSQKSGKKWLQAKKKIILTKWGSMWTLTTGLNEVNGTAFMYRSITRLNLRFQCSAYRCCLLGHETMQSYQWTHTRWRNILSPSSESRWHPTLRSNKCNIILSKKKKERKKERKKKKEKKKKGAEQLFSDLPLHNKYFGWGDISVTVTKWKRRAQEDVIHHKQKDLSMSEALQDILQDSNFFVTLGPSKKMLSEQKSNNVHQEDSFRIC
jgi:hypothetical protein